MLIVSACSTDKVRLNYDPSGVDVSGAAVVASVSVKDSRGTEPNWLGAIRGGFGNPIKTLLSEIPVSQVIQKAFSQGLKARGMLANSQQGKFTLIVDVKKFDCSQYLNREAHAHFAVSLVTSKTKRSIFSKVVRADPVLQNKELFDAGIMASVEDLRRVANDALQKAIDLVLDDPEFRSSLTRRGNASITPPRVVRVGNCRPAVMASATS